MILRQAFLTRNPCYKNNLNCIDMTETEARADPAQEPDENTETYEPIWIDEHRFSGLLEED